MAKKKKGSMFSSNGFTPSPPVAAAAPWGFTAFVCIQQQQQRLHPMTPGGKIDAAQAGTLYSQQQQWTAAGYGPTGDYTSKAQSWMQRAAARRINRRYMGGGMDQGYTSLLGYYYRARARAGLEQIAPQPTTVKEIVQWLSQRPGDDDYRQDRGAMFTVIFKKAAKEARAAGDSNSEETLIDAASKARKMARAQRRARRQAAAEGFNEFADGEYDEDFDLQGIVEDAHSSFQMAPVPIKAAVALGAVYLLRKIL